MRRKIVTVPITVELIEDEWIRYPRTPMEQRGTYWRVNADDYNIYTDGQAAIESYLEANGLNIDELTREGGAE